MTHSEWSTATLNNVLDKIIDYRGQSVPKAEAGIPLITARNVREGYLDFSSKEYVGEEQYENWMTRGTPKAGDVLITTEAPLGMVAMYPSDNQRYAVGQRTVTLRPSEKINSKFLMYYLIGPARKEIQERAGGSTAKGIKSSELKKVSISFPSVKEQEKIAKILSTWDEAIEKLDRLEKQLAIRHLQFGKQFFLDESVKTNLECVIEIIYGKSPKSYVHDCGKFPIIGTSGIVGYTNNPITKFPTVVLGRKGTLNNPIYISDPCFPIDTTFWTIPRNGYLLRWVFHLVRHLDLSRYNEASGVPSLSRDNLYKIEVPNHSERHQDKIVRILDNSMEEIQKISAIRKLIQYQKKGMMQQLLTCKKRVKI